MEGVARIVSREINRNGIGKVHLLIPWSGEEDLFVVQDYYDYYVVEARDLGYGDDYAIISIYPGNYVRTAKIFPVVAFKARGKRKIIKYVPDSYYFSDLLYESVLSGPVLKWVLELLLKVSTNATEGEKEPSWSTSPLPPYLNRDASLRVLRYLISRVFEEDTLEEKPSFTVKGWSFFSENTRYTHLSEIEDCLSYTHLFGGTGETKLVPVEVFSRHKWFIESKGEISELALSTFDEDRVFNEIYGLSEELSKLLPNMHLSLKDHRTVHLKLRACLGSQKYVGTSGENAEALVYPEVSIEIGPEVLEVNGVDLIAIPFFAFSLTNNEVDDLRFDNISNLPKFFMERLYLVIYLLPLIALEPERLKKAISKAEISIGVPSEESEGSGLAFLLLYESALCQDGVREREGRFTWLKLWSKLQEEVRKHLSRFKDGRRTTQVLSGSPLAKVRFSFVNKKHSEASKSHLWRVSSGVRISVLEEAYDYFHEDSLIENVVAKFYGKLTLAQPVYGKAKSSLTMVFPPYANANEETIENELRNEKEVKKLQGIETFKSSYEFIGEIYETLFKGDFSESLIKSLEDILDEDFSFPLQVQILSPYVNPVCIPLEGGRRIPIDSLMAEKRVYDLNLFIESIKRKVSYIAKAMSSKVDFEFSSVYPFPFMELWSLLLKGSEKSSSIYQKVARDVFRENPQLLEEIKDLVEMLPSLFNSGELGVIVDSFLEIGFEDYEEYNRERFSYQANQGFCLKLWEDEDWALLAYSEPDK